MEVGGSGGGEEKKKVSNSCKAFSWDLFNIAVHMTMATIETNMATHAMLCALLLLLLAPPGSSAQKGLIEGGAKEQSDLVCATGYVMDTLCT